MAEEKKSAGGFWGPFEVLVIILLVIGFISKFSSPNNGEETTKESAEKSVIKGSGPQVVSNNSLCGLTIARPKPLEVVNGKVVLSGKTEGCDWASTTDVALFAQVIDNKGVPLSSYTTIAPSSQDDQATYFYNEITLSETPKTTMGYLILVPAQRVGEKTKTARISLKFGR